VNTTLFPISAYVLGVAILVAYGISLWAQLKNTKDSRGEDGSRS
jgi:hypothetical protein